MKTRSLLISFILIFFGTQCALSQIKITGTVTDCEKNPLSGVRISTEMKREETVTVISDSIGHYKIDVRNKRSVLKFSLDGYIPQEVKVGRNKSINIYLTRPFETEEIIYIRKPVIYLYPVTETEVSLKVDFEGEFLFTYPSYGDGWRVTASPDGKLTNKADGRQYSYLFWDGLKEYSERYRTYETGSVVHRDSSVAFLQKILPEMGLEPHEYNEFIVYWTPYLMRNEWNFIHFRTGGDYDAVSTNLVSPRPETSIRVFMDFKGFDTPFDVEPQEVAAPPRKGFTLVEWGGMELKQPVKIRIGGEMRNM